MPPRCLPQDLGHGNVGWHRKSAPVPEVKTPKMDEIVASGVALERVYLLRSTIRIPRSSVIALNLPFLFLSFCNQAPDSLVG